MDNEIMEARSTIPAVRGIEIVTAEIREIRRQANTMAMMYAIEIGRRLVEAKSMLDHGEWGDWLKNEVDFSQSTANNLMRLFEEYGESQISIFGAVSNSQTIANLPYSKALMLLSLPAEEREDFAEEVGAEDLSVRELKEAIRERNEAKQEAERAAAREAEMAEKISEIEEAASDAEKARAEADELRAKVEELEKKNAETEEKLKKATSDPKLPASKMKEIEKDAALKAQQAEQKKTGAEIEKAKKAAEEAEAKLREAEARRSVAEAKLDELRKELKTASPAVTAFKVLFDGIQEQALRLKQKISEINEHDPETAGKLKAALTAFGKTL